MTGYDVHSLMNMAYVAGRFDVSRRRPGLSFSHHAELAALPHDDQELWLDRAEAGRLSVRALRFELRDARRRVAARTELAAGRGALPAGASRRPRPTPLSVSGNGSRRTQLASEVECPECGHHFDPAIAARQTA